MKHDRLTHDADTLADFFEEALGTLGALCERDWHDRLQVIAEGNASRLWRDDAEMHEAHLHFLPQDALQTGTAVDAASHVFPGCPLTFRLAETLRQRTLTLERAVLAPESRVPDTPVLEKLWNLQHPGTSRWRMLGNLKPAWHFSLVAVARCETQAIDQHWSLHRLAISLPDGSLDEPLADALATLRVTPDDDVPWPSPATANEWSALLTASIQTALTPELNIVRARQEKHLSREFARINDYFTAYEAELTERANRSRTPDAQSKLESRLTATRAEREHRQRDQLTRHEIRLIAHLDAMLLVAEPAVTTRISYHADHATHEQEALFIPRARRWQAPGGWAF